MTKLKFAKGNAKLGTQTAIFSLPAGYTCPGAKDCLSRSNRTTGKIVDGPACQFRCYAASSEALFKNIRISRWRNFDALKGHSVAEMSELIEKSLPKRNTKLVRIHASGDFFNQDYFDAWLLVARKHPDLIFYAYTKALPFWVRRLNSIPRNLKLVASYGGKYDSLILQYKLRSVTVVFSESQARRLKLKLDNDDTLAWQTDKSFALLLHGTQPAHTAASKAWQHIKVKGKGGYKADYFAHYAK